MVPSSALAEKCVTLESKLAPATNRFLCPNNSLLLVACRVTPVEVERVETRSSSPSTALEAKGLAIWTPLTPLAGVASSLKQSCAGLAAQGWAPVGLPSTTFWLNRRRRAEPSSVQVGVASTLPVILR